VEGALSLPRVFPFPPGIGHKYPKMQIMSADADKVIHKIGAKKANTHENNAFIDGMALAS